jgi:hypothetical protein
MEETVKIRVAEKIPAALARTDKCLFPPSALIRTSSTKHTIGNIRRGAEMPLLTPETVKRTLKDLYDQEISDEEAAPIANLAGAILSLAQNLDSLVTDDVQPPLGYGNLMAETLRNSAKK